MASDQPSPWWAPLRHADRKPFMMARSDVTKAVRAWFDEQGFVEVETGILQVSPGNETPSACAPAPSLRAPMAQRGGTLSADLAGFAAKKLLAAGEQKDFRIRPGVSRSRAWRSASAGVHHAGMVSRQCEL